MIPEINAEILEDNKVRYYLSVKHTAIMLDETNKFFPGTEFEVLDEKINYVRDHKGCVHVLNTIVVHSLKELSGKEYIITYDFDQMILFAQVVPGTTIQDFLSTWDKKWITRFQMENIL